MAKAQALASMEAPILLKINIQTKIRAICATIERMKTGISVAAGIAITIATRAATGATAQDLTMIPATMAATEIVTQEAPTATVDLAAAA